MPKLTSAQLWLFHSLEVLATGAVFTVVVTVYSAFQAGNFSLSAIGVTVGSAAVAFLSNGFKGIIANAQTAQAVSDSLNDLTQSHTVLGGQIANLAGIVQGLFHLHSATASPAQPPAPRPAPPQAQPQFVTPLASTTVVQSGIPMMPTGTYPLPAVWPPQ